MALRCHGIRNVFRKVNQDRSGPPFRRYKVSFGNHAGKISWVARNIAVLYARHGHADNIDLLEGICAHKVGRHLARDKDHRHRVEICISNRGNQVRRPRP